MVLSRTVRFNYHQFHDMGLDRHAAYRALNALEGAGLIAVQRHRGRCPIVTILDGNNIPPNCARIP